MGSIKMIKIKKAALALLCLASLASQDLRADLRGDEARARAATKAAIFATENVARLNREIRAKRSPISRTENLFESLRRRYEEIKQNVAKTQRQLSGVQQLFKGTQEKMNSLTKKGEESIREALPLINFLQQTAGGRDALEAQRAINKFQDMVKEVSELFKAELAAVERLQTALTALGVSEGSNPLSGGLMP
jgi:chromosome segregation ATPase